MALIYRLWKYSWSTIQHRWWVSGEVWSSALSAVLANRTVFSECSRTVCWTECPYLDMEWFLYNSYGLVRSSWLSAEFSILFCARLISRNMARSIVAIGVKYFTCWTSFISSTYFQPLSNNTKFKIQDSMASLDRTIWFAKSCGNAISAFFSDGIIVNNWAADNQGNQDKFPRDSPELGSKKFTLIF